MIETQIKEILSNVFSTELSAITHDFSQENVEGWDSLKQLNLVVALEEKFNIQIEPEEIAEIIDINSIEQLVKKKLKVNN
jgi:acyl carrier protein